MAPFGKIYGQEGNPRTLGLLAIAKENNLDVELVITNTANPETEYLKLNKLGLIPTFVGADGFIVYEAIAIAIYLTSQNEKTSLLGKTKKDYASILQWLSYTNSEVLPQIGKWFRPLVGKDPYNKKNVSDAEVAANKAIKTLEDHLLVNTYLVGERITLADIMSASFLNRGFENVLDKQWRQDHPNTTRWYQTIVNQPIYKAVAGDVKLVETALKNQPPAKPAAPKADTPKEAPKPKPKAKEPEDEDDEPAAPKAKHPLEALGKPALSLDDWKRRYRNDDTRGAAMPWLWENVDWSEWSLWQVDFKYNEELTMTFMSANQVGGFLNRLEGSRKFIQGTANVYGVANDSIIKGVFLVRGQEALPAFDVAPDYESYDFKKLDPKNPADKALAEDILAQDKGVEVNGKTYEWADGKIFV